jgi:predicted ATPase
VRLDQLPLAIELAAARTRHLSTRQLLERLTKRLDVLKAGRDVDPRQQTLRATIEWSYDLLSPDEQALFARIAIFSGGWTLDAVEEICDADLDTLGSLVDKSLVRHNEERYWLLETIREYAAERLEASRDTEHLRRRHAEYFLGWAERAGLDVDSVEAGAAPHLAAALADLDNLRAALDCLAAADPLLALAACG